MHLQFSLKTLLGLMLAVLCSSLIARWTIDLHRQLDTNARVLRHVDALGGTWEYGDFGIGIAYIYLTGTHVSDNDLQVLNELSTIECLFLANTDISDNGLIAIAEIRGLRSLDLGQTSVSDEGLRWLWKMNSLRDLDLSGTEITDEGLKHLRQMRSLSGLSLKGTQTSETEIRSLQLALPYCHIHH